MKRIVCLMLVILAILTGCSAKQPVETAKVRDLPEGQYTEKGDGTVYLSTAGGTTEEGNVPVIYASANSALQIGLTAWDFNGSALSYVYIDGMLNTKEQLANTQTTLMLQGDSLAAGVHVVEVVQYNKDDPASEMVTYRTMSYEVKPE